MALINFAGVEAGGAGVPLDGGSSILEQSRAFTGVAGGGEIGNLAKDALLDEQSTLLAGFDENFTGDMSAETQVLFLEFLWAEHGSETGISAA